MKDPQLRGEFISFIYVLDYFITDIRLLFYNCIVFTVGTKKNIF